MTNLDSIFKNRDITLLTKVRLVKAMVFPVVMYGCDSWSVKKAEGRRIDAFELWCWKRLLRVPWTSRRSNQSILEEISPGGFFGRNDAKAESPVLWPPHAKSWLIGKDWCWEGLGAGGEGDDRGWDGWTTSPTGWTWVWVNSGVGDGQGGLVYCNSWGHKESDMTEWLNWTELKMLKSLEFIQNRYNILNKAKWFQGAQVSYILLSKSFNVRASENKPRSPFSQQEDTWTTCP